MVTQEALIEEELYRLIRNIIAKERMIENVEFMDIRPQYPVDSKRADLALFCRDKALMVIECKRKVETAKGLRIYRDFDPLSSKVIDQALFYATKLGAPLFATTNGEIFTLFTTPKKGEPFTIYEHRLAIEKIALKQEYLKGILETVAKYYVGITVPRIPVDWFFIERLRSLVDFLAPHVKVSLEEELEENPKFKSEYEQYSKSIGEIDLETLSEEAAYILMNKIVFYKILERHYDLATLGTISAPDGRLYIQFLKSFFDKAIEITEDFEPIFITGIFDRVPLPNAEHVLDEVNAFIEEMDKYRVEEIGSDVVGFIYEELIPAEERHKLGQFYTPPAIAELIAKWAIRNPDDTILDPAVGSGTFLVKAYKRLRELKETKYEKAKLEKSSEELHQEVLGQLYADDINPFPSHLTAMNLAMRDVRHPSSEVNVIVEDFFNLAPKQAHFAPYRVKTPKGEVQRSITIPPIDAVIANPPYTRWTEIPEKTRESIQKDISDTLKKYGLYAGIGREMGIYIPFIIYATKFLKSNGRLAMIISNSWLQSDYGIQFTNFLLEKYRINGVIDFSSRLFRIPLVSTCVIFLQREGKEDQRIKNKTVFAYIDENITVDETLDVVNNPEKWTDKFLVNVKVQGDLPRNRKWIEIIFDTRRIEEAILSSPNITSLEKLFNPRHGNLEGIFPRGGTGANAFFYLNNEQVRKWGLVDFVCPLVESSRYSNFFTLTKRDWEELRKGKKPSFSFIAHSPREKLPNNVRDYIKHGETELRTRAGKTCDRSIASQRREREKNFHGWYDLGSILHTPLYVPYYAQYVHRFSLATFPVALDADFIAFVPKITVNNKELEALAAYLNSTFMRIYLESHGRTTGGGMLALEVSQAKDLPLLNVKNFKDEDVRTLADLFHQLELKAREIGGAEKMEYIQKLEPIVDKIDMELAKMLHLPEEIIDRLKKLRNVLIERRIARAEKAKPEAVRGEEKPKIKPLQIKKKQEKPAYMPLDQWISTD